LHIRRLAVAAFVASPARARRSLRAVFLGDINAVEKVSE
jgi:hypothetical protein